MSVKRLVRNEIDLNERYNTFEHCDLAEYNYVPSNYPLLKVNREPNIFIGVEMELLCDNDLYINDNEILSHIKWDGSLNGDHHGWEMVLNPMTLEMFEDKGFDYFKEFIKNNEDVHTDYSCGIHTHINTTALKGFQRQQLFLFVDKYSDNFFNISERYEKDYVNLNYFNKLYDNNLSSEEIINMVEEQLDIVSTEKYKTVRSTYKNRSGTVEFRLFSSTTNLVRFKEIIYFVNSLIKFFRKLKEGVEPTFQDYVDYVKSNEYMFNMLEDKGIIDLDGKVKNRYTTMVYLSGYGTLYIPRAFLYEMYDKKIPLYTFQDVIRREGVDLSRKNYENDMRIILQDNPDNYKDKVKLFCKKLDIPETSEEFYKVSDDDLWKIRAGYKNNEKWFDKEGKRTSYKSTKQSTKQTKKSIQGRLRFEAHEELINQLINPIEVMNNSSSTLPEVVSHFFTVDESYNIVLFDVLDNGDMRRNDSGFSSVMEWEAYEWSNEVSEVNERCGRLNRVLSNQNNLYEDIVVDIAEDFNNLPIDDCYRFLSNGNALDLMNQHHISIEINYQNITQIMGWENFKMLIRNCDTVEEKKYFLNNWLFNNNILFELFSNTVRRPVMPNSLRIVEPATFQYSPDCRRLFEIIDNRDSRFSPECERGRFVFYRFEYNDREDMIRLFDDHDNNIELSSSNLHLIVDMDEFNNIIRGEIFAQTCVNRLNRMLAENGRLVWSQNDHRRENSEMVVNLEDGGNLIEDVELGMDTRLSRQDISDLRVMNIVIGSLGNSKIVFINNKYIRVTKLDGYTRCDVLPSENGRTYRTDIEYPSNAYISERQQYMREGLI